MEKTFQVLVIACNGTLMAFHFLSKEYAEKAYNDQITLFTKSKLVALIDLSKNGREAVIAQTSNF